MKRSQFWVLLLCACIGTAYASNTNDSTQKKSTKKSQLPTVEEPTLPEPEVTEDVFRTIRQDSTIINTTHETRPGQGGSGIDSITTHSTHWQVQVADSIMQVTQSWQNNKVEDEPVFVGDTTRRGHHFRAWIGGGYGSIGYAPKGGSIDTDATLGGTAAGHGAAAVALQYAYFWHPEWGFSIGVGASSYGSHATNSFVRSWQDQTDTNGERYEHRIDARDIEERQHTWMIDVPVEFDYQHLFKSQKAGLYLGLGANVGIPVSTQYKVLNGEVEHIGYYDKWNLEIRGHRDFYTESTTTTKTTKMLLPAVAGTAKIGFFFPVNENVDILLGLYGRYTLNNIQRKDIESPAFMHTEYEGEEAYKNHTFMEREYAGMLGTTQVEKMHPWQAGLQLGVEWHHVDRRTETPYHYEQLATYDTLYISRPRAEKSVTQAYDTAFTPVYELKRLMDKSIIWFDLNSYVPKLDPADILEQMAAVLIANPGLRVNVNGHTCTIGKRAYNQKLSEKRAQAVADRLIKLGVNPNQLECHGYCSDKPYFSQSHQLFLDRRCEIIPIEETNTKKVRKN